MIHHVRIERPVLWGWISDMPGLMAIDFYPPASGPEIELKLDLPNDQPAVQEIVEEITKKLVLAQRST